VRQMRTLVVKDSLRLVVISGVGAVNHRGAGGMTLHLDRHRVAGAVAATHHRAVGATAAVVVRAVTGRRRSLGRRRHASLDDVMVMGDFPW